MEATKQAVSEISEANLDEWATDTRGPVALHLKQRLAPVESPNGEGGIVYPPTYADIGYNIDVLSDGTKVALIDSVGSQANRMEPVFMEALEGEEPNPLAQFIPQIKIIVDHRTEGTNTEWVDTLSLLEIPHRAADAIVRSCPGLVEELESAFQTLRQSGNCSRLCELAPTSLVFGVWDSRGGSGEKRPRLVRSIIRAWDVEELHAAAQYTSTAKLLDDGSRDELKEELEKLKKKKRGVSKLSDAGFAEVPSLFRKSKMADFIDGKPNPEARIGGGVLVHGAIERDVTINLLALRGLRGGDPDETARIQKYLLGLTLLTAIAETDLFLREGCLLRHTGKDIWHAIPRRAAPMPIELSTERGAQCLMDYTKQAHSPFKERLEVLIKQKEKEEDKYFEEWQRLSFKFDLGAAKNLLLKKNVKDGED